MSNKERNPAVGKSEDIGGKLTPSEGRNLVVLTPDFSVALWVSYRVISRQAFDREATCRTGKQTETHERSD